MYYEIINPSDKYVMEADSDAVAAAAGLLIGTGQLGVTLLHPDGSSDTVLPIFFGGDAVGWFQETHGSELTVFIETNKAAIVATLESVTLGSVRDRMAYKKALDLIDDPAKKELWRTTWDKDRRSSLSAWGNRAHAIARALAEQIADKAS